MSVWETFRKLKAEAPQEPGTSEPAGASSQVAPTPAESVPSGKRWAIVMTVSAHDRPVPDIVATLIESGALSLAEAPGVGLAAYDWWGARDIRLAQAVTLDCPWEALHLPFLPAGQKYRGHGFCSEALARAEREGLAVRAGCWRPTARAVDLMRRTLSKGNLEALRDGWLEWGGSWTPAMPTEQGAPLESWLRYEDCYGTGTARKGR